MVGSARFAAAKTLLCQCRAGAAVLVLVSAAACSPLESTPIAPVLPDGGAGGVGGGGGAGGSGLTGPDSLVVEVVTTELDDYVARQPGAGAVVALDLPGDVKVEQTVGAGGRVVFEGLDWSLPESTAVTAYLPGFLPQSFVGLTAETVPVLAELDGTEELTLALVPVDPQLVVLSGVATNMTDTSHDLYVTATTRCHSHHTTGAGWDTHAQPELPHTLVVVEHHAATSPTVSSRGFEREWLRWAEQEQDAVSGDAMGISIDMDAGALSATDVSGSFAIPDHGISSFFTKAAARA